ncbi:hypothetical protein ACQPU1_08090 [Clostridium paraputrificum]|uniref:hypothetical protein n=1 Tax=Clostridium TaxID=1485 RepID=UPI003D32C37B
MLGFKIFNNENEDEDEVVYCIGCNKVIEDSYYYDNNTQKLYCSEDCYINQIEKEYMEE